MGKLSTLDFPHPSSHIVICHLHLLVNISRPCRTINELPRGSIDPSWPLLRRALLLSPPKPGASPPVSWQALQSVDLSDDSKVGVPASAECSLWEWIFLQPPPPHRPAGAGCISAVRANADCRALLLSGGGTIAPGEIRSGHAGVPS